MNLTEPPPVRRPDAQRRAELRSALVGSAADDLRATPRRTWLPVLAATATVATVAAAAVVLPHLAPRDDSTPTDRTTASTATIPSTAGTTTAKPVAMAPAPPTRPGPRAVSTDLGPATMAEVRTMVRTCVSRQDVRMMYGRIDARTATIEWGRWIAVPRLGSPDDARRSRQPGRALVASVAGSNGKYRMLCYDGVQMGGEQLEQPGDVKIWRPDRTYPIDGGCAATNERRGARWLLEARCTYTVFDQARVDMRLVWTGGAGAWHTAVGGRGYGLVDLVATGTGGKRSNVRLDVRVVDRDGSVFYRTNGPMEVPIGSVHR